jgi:hypothetical protein
VPFFAEELDRGRVGPGRTTKDAPARLNCWPAEMLKYCPVQSLGNFAVVAPSRGAWGFKALDRCYRLSTQRRHGTASKISVSSPSSPATI